MAKITQPAETDRLPVSLEVRPWLKAAYTPQTIFSLPDGGFTMAHSLYWLDVTCTVGANVLFYTRNLIQPFQDELKAADLEPLFTGEPEGWRLGGMYPDTSLTLKRQTFEQSVWYVLEIDLNVSRVFGARGDEWRVVFKLDEIDVNMARAFLQELEQEFATARSGVAPDPACVPDGYGTLPFARRINARAYDVISAEYGDRLFDDEMYLNAFEDWVARPWLPHCSNAASRSRASMCRTACSLARGLLIRLQLSSKLGPVSKPLLDDRKDNMKGSAFIYLPVLGVASEFQGQGWGGKLLSALIARSEQAGIPLYLETQSESNVRWYERFGFESVKQINLPVINLPMWEMARKPKT